MAKIQLKDCLSGEIHNCVIWQEKLSGIDARILSIGNILSILGFDYNEKYKSFTLNEFELVEKAKVGLEMQEIELLFNNIIKSTKQISDKSLSSSILNIIYENEIRFKLSPAAEYIHHNYMGGLLQHIWECIMIAKAIFPVMFKKINQDQVIAGCIMHDFGKIFEYIYDPEINIISKDKEFQNIWINHIHWGFSWANQHKFPDLAHIIASHHGTKEWNALLEPVTPEANLLHQIDMISSRLGKISVIDLEISLIS